MNQTQCIDVGLIPCHDWVQIPIVASETGTWNMILSFNGCRFTTSITVVSGEDIIIPNRLNENYVHLLKLYNTSGALVNDTCYYLKTVPSFGINTPDSGPTPPTPGSNKQDYTIQFVTTADQTSYQNDDLIDAELISFSIEGSDIYEGDNPGEMQPLDVVTGTLTWNEAPGTAARCKIVYKK